jgi:hypothetical protein
MPNPQAMQTNATDANTKRNARSIVSNKFFMVVSDGFKLKCRQSYPVVLSVTAKTDGSLKRKQAN